MQYIVGTCPGSIGRLMHPSYKRETRGSNPLRRTISSNIPGHWRSQVAHPAFNRTVMGSNPIWPTTSTKHKCRGSQVVKGGRLKTFSQRSSQVQILSPTPIHQSYIVGGLTVLMGLKHGYNWTEHFTSSRGSELCYIASPKQLNTPLYIPIRFM